MDFNKALAVFKNEYKESVEVLSKPGVFHGRVIIIDNRCHLIDHSIKDFGSKPSSIVNFDEPPANDFYIQLFEDNGSINLDLSMQSVKVYILYKRVSPYELISSVHLTSQCYTGGI